MSIESLGEVETPYGTLRCTLRAWENLNTYFGSYGEAYRRITAMDAAAVVKVISEGSGRKFDDVKNDVFKGGLTGLVEPIGKYILMLSNGGKMPDEGKAGDDDNKGEG